MVTREMASILCEVRLVVSLLGDQCWVVFAKKKLSAYHWLLPQTAIGVFLAIEIFSRLKGHFLSFEGIKELTLFFCNLAQEQPDAAPRANGTLR